MPAVPFASNHVQVDTLAGLPTFARIGEGAYHLGTADGMTLFVAERIRVERGHVVGNLAVVTSLPGVPTVDGTLSDASFTFDSLRDRRDRAIWLAGRAKTDERIDWEGLLEEFCQRVLGAEREGSPAIDLQTLPPAPAEAFHDVLGLQLPVRHLAIPFGDGGAGKTWLGEIVVGELAQRGVRVAYLDWELDEFTHRDRFKALFGSVPPVIYIRCDRPLVYDLDRAKRLVVQHRIAYAVLDSVGFACAGAPESAEAALGFCSAFRRLGIGGLGLAHISKAEGADQRPFGSSFWHNSARATWFVKPGSSDTESRKTLGLFNRKANLRGFQPPIGVELTFAGSHIGYRVVDVADDAALAEGLPLWQRIKTSVQTGPKTFAVLGEELGANVGSVEKAVRRKSGLFVLVPGSDHVTRVALKDRRFE